MTEKEQNRLIFLALIIGVIALLWAALRNAPGVGNVIRGLESGDWLPPMGAVNVPSFDSGDIVIQPLQFADWGPRDPKTIGDTTISGGKETCGCNAFICPPEDAGLATFSPNIINAAIYGMPYSGNVYLGY